MKLLIVTPHLSTGGLPQYLVAQITRQLEELDIAVVEYDFAGDLYVVQRQKVQDMIARSKDRFHTLGEKKEEELLGIIDRFKPDVIHWAEIPEMFCDRKLAARIYGRPNRTYRLVETTHTCTFDPRGKVFLPDRFVFVSAYSLQQYASFKVNQKLAEYPVEAHERPDRTVALDALGLDSDYRHVLNVGLFTPGKNQAEAYEMARKLTNRPVQFHFVGNQAPNFADYWRGLKQPINCRCWGEQDDVDAFYSAMDLFLFTSQLELNPLVLKEAASWNMPILMRDLPTYCGQYEEGGQIHFLTNNLEDNVQKLTELLTL